MQALDIYYLRGVNFTQKHPAMHDLKANFDKILPIIKQTLADQLNSDGNLQFYPNKPAWPDSYVITFALLQEALGINSERWLWGKIQTDYSADFPSLPHRTRYNRRRKRLAGWIETLAKLWSRQIRPCEDTYIVDSIPIPVAHIAREHSYKVCRQRFATAPDKGYSGVFQQYYIGYKLHLVITLDGLYRQMDLTKASIHDIHYLDDIKAGSLTNCLLLADKGYLSAQRQLDLFCSNGIDLQTPKRSNQPDYRPWPKLFKHARRRVETVFGQLCDHMKLKQNYAKTFAGLRARIISKITSFTMLQLINYRQGKTINHVKYALAT